MASVESKFNLHFDELNGIVKKHYADQDVNFNITSTQIISLNGTNPAGFYGEHYILKVFGIVKDDHSDEEQEIQFFLKFMSSENEYLKTLRVFQKEIFMFEKLLPQLEMHRYGGKEWAANCYLIQDNKLLVFENLYNTGYELCPSPNNDKSLDVHHIMLTLDTIANFHAASFVFEMKTGQNILQQYPNDLDENAYPSKSTTTRYINLQSCVEVLVELAKNIPKYRKNFDHIETGLRNIFKKIHKFCEPSERYRNVVNHGDLWKNNILYKYEVREKLNGERVLSETQLNHLIETHRVPVDSILCDFQLCRYVPPAADVMTLLVINCKNLDRYLDDLLDFYYEKLTMALFFFMDQPAINDILSREIFFQSCCEYKLFGLLESCLFNLTILLPQHLSVKLIDAQQNFDEFIKQKCRLKLCLEAFDTDHEFHHRMTDNLSQLIDDYILAEK